MGAEAGGGGAGREGGGTMKDKLASLESSAGVSSRRMAIHASARRITLNDMMIGRKSATTGMRLSMFVRLMMRATARRRRNLEPGPTPMIRKKRSALAVRSERAWVRRIDRDGPVSGCVIAAGWSAYCCFSSASVTIWVPSMSVGSQFEGDPKTTGWCCESAGAGLTFPLVECPVSPVARLSRLPTDQPSKSPDCRDRGFSLSGCVCNRSRCEENTLSEITPLQHSPRSAGDGRFCPMDNILLEQQIARLQALVL
ncbi:hypothetical protein LMG29739_05810 [Paraburkholderia solisilvae]|uniref:Uncharacterized protein n=1 Tax=Paraburkholderia solisilvae TaxID=624376 RepID=A0A6J5EVC2_9BURK|nr:hypothetical protein LMG29739_05810 [Paraburkholderia solisilvae]